MRSIYTRLVSANMKNNKQFYIPYVLTGIISVVLFYTMVAMQYNQGIREVRGAGYLYTFLNIGRDVVGFFVIIFLFYTNSFIIKRRKKELGLYNILGMEKKHISKVLCLETLVVAIDVIVGGLVIGILFNKFFIMFLYRLIHFEATIRFEVSEEGICQSVILFGIIFCMTLVYNLLQVKLSNPIELLKGGNVGEKEPKTKLLMTILGVICIGIGYGIALKTESPLDAIVYFFIAVIFVIVGTYSLFTAGSIALLKLLRKNKKYYYKTSHFTAVSGMLYRMKQNAVGLANICILSTMVLIIISTTVSMFVGLEDELKHRYPAESYVKITSVEWIEKDGYDECVKETIASQGRTLLESKSYVSLDVTAKLKEGKLIGETESFSNFSEVAMFEFVLPEDAKATCGETAKELASDEVLIYGNPKYEWDTIDIFGVTYRVAEDGSKELATGTDEYVSGIIGGAYYVVLPDQTAMDTVYRTQAEMYGEDASIYRFSGYYDMDGTKEEKIACHRAIIENINPINATVYGESREANRGEIYAINGSLLFLGIFLGVMFLMVTCLIIYFKQISEGYDDKDRFVIMQKVGMSNKEVKASISSQVRIVFFLPIIVAAIHVAFAFPIITKLLALLNLVNVPLFIGCLIGTLVVFMLIYYSMFKWTSVNYYRIVGNHGR